jgi:hypothetical protein
MKQLETCPSVQAAEYVPVAGDFAQLEQADIATDTNYASQGYWKGVATHFVRNKRAMIGLILVLLMIFWRSSRRLSADMRMTKSSQRSMPRDARRPPSASVRVYLPSTRW